jgi:hypothetical protein
MFRFLKRLFHSPKPHIKLYFLEGYHCYATVRSKKKIRTPCQSLVTVLQVCVDIDYSVSCGQIHLHDVRLSWRGFTIMGCDRPLNVSSDRTGESWYSKGPGDRALLMQAVQSDLRDSKTRLYDRLLAPWVAENQSQFADEVAKALSKHSSTERIASILQYCMNYIKLEFTYTKSNGSCDQRIVTLNKLSGDCIWALDHKDDKMKTFRIDRISNARAIK